MTLLLEGMRMDAVSDISLTSTFESRPRASCNSRMTCLLALTNGVEISQIFPMSEMGRKRNVAFRDDGARKPTLASWVAPTALRQKRGARHGDNAPYRRSTRRAPRAIPDSMFPSRFSV